MFVVFMYTYYRKKLGEFEKEIKITRLFIINSFGAIALNVRRLETDYHLYQRNITFVVLYCHMYIGISLHMYGLE